MIKRYGLVYDRNLDNLTIKESTKGKYIKYKGHLKCFNKDCIIEKEKLLNLIENWQWNEAKKEIDKIYDYFYKDK